MIHSEMMDRMTAMELNEWMAFYRLEHEHRDDASIHPTAQTPQDMLKALGG